MSNSNNEHAERVGNDAQNAQEVEIRKEMHEEDDGQDSADVSAAKDAAEKVAKPKTESVGNVAEHAQEAASRIAENDK